MPKASGRSSSSRPRDPDGLVVQYRLEHGLCYKCGTQVYETTTSGGRRRLVAKDVPGVVTNGRCLHCYPDVPGSSSAGGGRPPADTDDADPGADAAAADAAAADDAAPRDGDGPGLQEAPRLLPGAVSPSPVHSSTSTAPENIGSASQQQRSQSRPSVGGKSVPNFRGKPNKSVGVSRGEGNDSDSSSSLALSSIDSSSDDDISVKSGKRAAVGLKTICVTSGNNEKAKKGNYLKVTVSDAKGNEFIGTIREGTVKEGRGTFTRVNIDGNEFATKTYEGNIKKGKFHGKGTRTHANGDVFKGEFRNGAANGRGRLVSADRKWVYEGEFKNDKKHGRGCRRQMEEGGEVYDGEYRCDKWHGKGKLNFAGGGAYEGDFKNDKFNGEGRYEFVDGSVYVGTFKNDIREGEGTMTYASDKCKYKGEWKKNWRHGQGTLTHEDGSLFAGTFREDKKDGVGTLTLPDGTCKKETWYRGELVES